MPRCSSACEKLPRISDWSFSIAAWVIQDGNYPDFKSGQRAEFAVEFYAPERLTRGPGGARSAAGEGNGWYELSGTVVAVTESAWFVDCGIVVYDERPPKRIRVGDGVAGRVLLSVDHYMYFESLAKQREAPSLIYTWDLVRIRRETAPYVPDKSGRLYVRDEAKRGLVEVAGTDAWEDDDGHAEYVFDCRLRDLPPKRSRATAA
jgi:hypothetical protein